MENIKEQLATLGFNPIGSGWYSNERDTIRIREWKDNEMDFWEWKYGDTTEDSDNSILLFRGKIGSIADIKWVLYHCFGIKLPEQ